MLPSDTFSSRIENEFARRNFCGSSKFEGYRSEYSRYMNTGALNMSICKATQFQEVLSSNWEAEVLSHDLYAHPKFETHFTF